MFIEGEEQHLGSFIYEGDNWGTSIVIGLDSFGDSDRGDSDQLSDMEALDDVVTRSLIAFYEGSWGKLELTVSSDVSSKHDGTVASLGYAYTIEYQDWRFIPSVKTTWFSKDVSGYYYGVNQNDATVGRAFYQPNTGVNYGIEFGAEYHIERNQLLMFSAEMDFLSKEIKDSPIIEESTMIEGTLGYMYLF